jgi:two-component system, NarL family, response regulator NreC
MTMTISILLADDHHVVRQGLRALLEAEPDFHVVGEAADGLEAVQLVERLQPDVLVADVMMHDLGGLEATRQVRERFPKTQVVVLSMHSNEAYVLQALRNGAMGYVLKDSNAGDLVKAVREVYAGHRYLSPPLSDYIIDAYVNKSQDTELDTYETLTNREREVLHLAAQGHTNIDIASRLSISPRTVEIHRTNMMRKLSLHTEHDLIRYALRRGILPPDV